MNYTGGGSLAATGLGTATIAGIAFDQLWMVALLFLIVGVAAFGIRFGFRSNLGIAQVKPASHKKKAAEDNR